MESAARPVQTRVCRTRSQTRFAAQSPEINPCQVTNLKARELREGPSPVDPLVVISLSLRGQTRFCPDPAGSSQAFFRLRLLQGGRRPRSLPLSLQRPAPSLAGVVALAHRGGQGLRPSPSLAQSSGGSGLAAGPSPRPGRCREGRRPPAQRRARG